MQWGKTCNHNQPPVSSSFLCNPLHYFALSRSRLGRLPVAYLSGCRLSDTIPGFAVMAAMQARRFFVSGLVQGVGFRFFAQRAAAGHGLSGYAKNLRDGRVEVYAIGAAAGLAALRHDLDRGPRGAEVTDVAEQEAAVEPRYASSFVIEHDW
jgi:acylphosphatase